MFLGRHAKHFAQVKSEQVCVGTWVFVHTWTTCSPAAREAWEYFSCSFASWLSSCCTRLVILWCSVSDSRVAALRLRTEISSSLLRLARLRPSSWADHYRFSWIVCTMRCFYNRFGTRLGNVTRSACANLNLESGLHKLILSHCLVSCQICCRNTAWYIQHWILSSPVCLHSGIHVTAKLVQHDLQASISILLDSSGSDPMYIKFKCIQLQSLAWVSQSHIAKQQHD